jgi:hypothetical protein
MLCFLFSLLPGESRAINIKQGDKATSAPKVQLLVDGWSAEAQKFFLQLRWPSL